MVFFICYFCEGGDVFLPYSSVEFSILGAPAKGIMLQKHWSYLGMDPVAPGSLFPRDAVSIMTVNNNTFWWMLISPGEENVH